MAARFAALALASLAVLVHGQNAVSFGAQFVVPERGTDCQQVQLPQLYHFYQVSMSSFCAGCALETFNIQLMSNYAGQSATFGMESNATEPATYFPRPTLPYPQQGKTAMEVCVSQPNGPAPVNVTLQLWAWPADVPLPCNGVDGIAGAQSLCVQRDGKQAIAGCGVQKYACQDGCIGTFNTPLPVETQVFSTQNHLLPYTPLAPGLLRPLRMLRLFNVTQMTVTATCPQPCPRFVHRLRNYLSSNYFGDPVNSGMLQLVDGTTVTWPFVSAEPFPSLGKNAVYLSVGTYFSEKFGVQVNTSFVGTTVEIPNA